MFDFCKKESNPASPAPVDPRFFLTSNGYDEYHITIEGSGINYRVEEVVKKLLQVMEEMKISNEIAMQVPTALHAAIARSFEQCIVTTMYKPLVHDRDDQRNNGDDQSEN